MSPIGIGVAALAVIGISLHILFMQRLQLQCPDEWVRLGSPNPFLPNDARTGWRLTKYVMRGAFETLPDKRVVQLGRILRVFEWLWVCGWTLYIALVLFVAIPAWRHWIWHPI
jgi:hypothetical protein